MNPAPSYAPMTIDAQQIDKVEAVGGEVEMTLTAMPRGSDGPSCEIRIRFDLETTRGLAGRLNAAIFIAGIQLQSWRQRRGSQANGPPNGTNSSTAVPRNA
jgi:hypothetical protein